MDDDEESRVMLNQRWTSIAEAMQASPHVLTRLCDACQKIFTLSPVSGKYETTGGHHTTAEQCRNSASSGCPICAAVWCHASRDDYKYDVPTLEVDLKDRVFSTYSISFNGEGAYCIPHWSDDTVSLQVLTGNVSYARGLNALHVWAHDKIDFGIFRLDGEVGRVDVREPDPSLPAADTSVAQAIRSSSTDAEDVWEMIHRWLGACVDKYSCSRPGVEDVDGDEGYPSRLLDVGTLNDDYIYLRESRDLEKLEPYVTLSHCWGQKSHFRLLDPSQAHDPDESFVTVGQERVSIGALPRTFRDAVMATRKLGKRFLWIDSLCIVQNSEGAADWLRESVKMGAIYGGSYCTLASDGSPDNHGGLFFERDTSLVNPLIFMSRESQETHIIMHSNFWRRAISDSYLGRRGWALQERYLSPAVLHFGQEQVFFECHEFEACEWFPRGLPPFAWESSLRFKSNSSQDAAALRSAQRGPDEDSKDGSEVDETLDQYYLWSQLVEKYTRTSFTFDGDRLVAIQGLGEFFAENSGGFYGSGFMCEILPSQLMWRVEDDRKSHMFFAQDQTPNHNLPHARRPRDQSYTPTWSWASVVGPVMMPTPMRGGSLVDVRIVLPSHVNLRDPEAVQVMAQHRAKGKGPTFLEVHGRLHFGYLWFNPSAISWCVSIETEGYGTTARFISDPGDEDPPPVKADPLTSKNSRTSSESANPGETGNALIPLDESHHKQDIGSDEKSGSGSERKHAPAIVQLDTEENARMPKGMKGVRVLCLPVIDTGRLPKVALHKTAEFTFQGISGLILVPSPTVSGYYQRAGVFDIVGNGPETQLRSSTGELGIHSKLFLDGQPGVILLQ